ncbi:MAG: kinase [Pseudoxanthomonas sp.]|nr:kinase [Pseudoxanthomonas sp.]
MVTLASDTGPHGSVLRYCRRMSDYVHSPRAGFEAALVGAALQAALSTDRRLPVFGIVGLQGSGKSTLAAQVSALAESRGLRTAVVSLDDFYLERQQRLQLARQVHPLLATRGPPGTHDLALALSTMVQLQEGRRIALPRFDKLADDRLPRTQWPVVAGHCDLVILEGWFLKTPAQHDLELQPALNPLERNEDGAGTWRRWCNEALAREYPALWQCIDRLWFLQGPGLEVVPGWRWEQEQALQAAHPGPTGMDRGQIDRFVQLFERVSRQALRALPHVAERTIMIDSERRPLRFS